MSFVLEKEHIERVLKHFNGNKRQTALAIGWAINTLGTKMEKYGIMEVLVLFFDFKN